MAHVGKFWKLAFRRDLANATGNAQAWAEGYALINNAFLTADGSLFPQIEFRVLNLLKDGQPPMVWVSDATPSPFGNLVATWTLTDPQIKFGISGSLRIVSTPAFYVWESPAKVDSLTDGEGGLLGGTSDWKQTNGGGMPHRLADISFSCEALRWADYPP